MMKEISLEGKTALVTGGASGIGYAIAKKLSQNGYAVVITGRNIKTLECVSHELGGNVFPMVWMRRNLIKQMKK